MGKMLTLCEVSIDERAVTQACAKLVLYPARRRRLNTRKVTCMHTRSKDFANEESVYTLYVLTAHSCAVLGSTELGNKQHMLTATVMWATSLPRPKVIAVLLFNPCT